MNDDPGNTYTSSIHMLLLIILLRLSLISAFCMRFCPIHPKRTLKIEAYSTDLSRKRNFFSYLTLIKAKGEYDFLMELYEAAENDGMIDVSKLSPMYFREIFGKNALFVHTPAEWAIFNENITVLRFFLYQSLHRISDPFLVGTCFKDLIVASIKFGKLESFKVLWQSSPEMIGIEDYLIIAVQHHINNEFWTYLLNESSLIDFVKERSVRESYTAALNAAIKFNNILATRIFLERLESLPRSPINQSNDYISDVLKSIMSLNRIRLLENLMSLQMIYSFRDDSGFGILHYAAKHSNDPKMFEMILDKSQKAFLDLIKASDVITPLELCLQVASSNVEKIAEVLIVHGADIFLTNYEDRTSPIELIIGLRLKTIFALILGIHYENNAIMSEFIDMCTCHESWSILDEILLKRPDLIDSLPTTIVPTLSSLQEQLTPITFRFCLEKKLIAMDEEFMEWLLSTNSLEYIKIALECGVDHNHLSLKAFARATDNTLSEEISKFIILYEVVNK